MCPLCLYATVEVVGSWQLRSSVVLEQHQDVVHSYPRQQLCQRDDRGNSSYVHRRRLYIVCPKCILLRVPCPDLIEYSGSQGAGRSHRRRGPAASSSSLRRKPICTRWHNLGSWARVVTGDYRSSTPGVAGADTAGRVSRSGGQGPGQAGQGGRCTQYPLPATLGLSDRQHPRLVLVLPATERLSLLDWLAWLTINYSCSM